MPHPYPYKVLSASEVRVVHALAETCCPPGQIIKTTPAGALVAERVDWFLEAAPVEGRTAFRFALLALEWSPVFRLLALSRFSRLPPEKREVQLKSWSGSRVWLWRNLLKLLMALVVPAYYADDQVSGQTGFTPPGGRPSRFLAAWKERTGS
ncbi:MAG: hypothetical protein GMKNLPBB_02224 [Myxococcota bacterium]|nr:hypothetical protein [Myxococcota bacterium]